ncbi:MAG: Cna B-type domain-containing protein, partial [Tenericutes bacterium]|nr:Cna B-type domain-containing protein [Mycoplasmatota bacterium]
NPERTTTPKYKNVTALNYEELAKEFQTIAEFTKDVVAKNAKVTDVIPKEFELTAESITALEEKGVKVTKNKTTGETTLEWTIGDLQGNKDNSLTYTVKANDDYHGSIYTNTKATLSAKIDKDNPYPEYKDQTNLNLTFDKPTVEIPAVIKDDHYNDKKHDSYNGYENTTINGVESILTNDLLDEIRADVASNATKVEVVDEVIINTDTNVVKIANNTYTISKDGVLQGTLTMHDDGTFTFDPEAGITGEVSFTYYVKTTINEYQEISAVKSNVATVTLNIIPSPKTSISGEKIWDDAHNQDGLRPQAITVRLFNDKEEVASKRVTGVNDKWPYEFTNLPKYETGHENDENYLINYTIQEDPVESYEPKIDGFNIVNKHTPKLINISVTKIWNDDNNNDGKRPESITLKLYKGEGTAKTEVTTVTLTSTAATTDSATWTYEFTDLPEKENGNKIIYTVTEDEVTDYTGKVTGNMETGFTITNTHTNVTRDLTIEKIWQDSNNNDGKRPEKITVRLYKLVGQDKIEVENTAATLTRANATSENNWSYTYSNLPKYENGEEITYIVEEDKLDSSLGYTPEYDYANYKIFNIYRTEIFSIEGTKTWDDGNNRDGLRPKTIEVTLTGKVGTKEVYKETKTVSAADNWSYKFTDLAKYNAGSIIDYKISEKNVEGYSPTIDNNYNITNTHTPEKVTITGKKVWDDADNQDGKRPESITVILNKTVKGKTTEADRTTVKADENGNWNFTFADLFAKEDGENITYTVDEVTIDGYTKRIKDYTITNTHTPETISYNLSKNWEDYDNNDGIRPEKITVKVYANGEVVKTIEISAANNWTATTGALPKYKDGQEISYSFVEDEVKGYEAGVSQPVVDNDGNVTIVFTNYHELETIDITIEKEWDDAGNKNSRPDSIIVNVFADSEQIETIEITAADNWKYTLEGLQKYQDGKEIEYTIEEIKLDNYVTRYEGYKIINSYKATGEIVPPDTGIKTTSSNSNNLYRELIVLLLGAASITYTFKKKEN